jgi:NifB/MoaA-like Fe-S oxidoreductase
VAPVGLTRHHKYGHRPCTREESERVLDSVAKWQAKFIEQFGVRFVYPTDEWLIQTGRPIPPKKFYDGLALEENGLGQVRGFLEEWRRVKREIREKRETRERKELKGKRATLITGTLFEETLRKAADEFNGLAGTKLDVIGVLNERLGHTITVAGLLMGSDVMAQLQSRELGAYVVLPRVMFDHPQGISLDDISPLQIAQALNCVVYLADAMGDVLDALTGVNTLRFDSASDSIPLEVMKAGGWAVEKYL